MNSPKQPLQEKVETGYWNGGVNYSTLTKEFGDDNNV